MTNIKVDYLNWDSTFFGLKVGKVDISLIKNSGELIALEESIQQLNYDLIYIFSNISQMPLFEFKKMMPILVDTQIYLKMKIPLNIKSLKYELVTNNNISNMNIRIEDLYKISDEISLFSRFNNDPRISKEKISGLYREFIDNSLDRSLGKGLIIDSDNQGKTIGLISLDNIDILGKEIVIGVENSYRGKGSGKRLFNKGLNYWQDNGVKEIETVVSARNLNSLNFHLGLGFNIFKIYNIYHLWV